MVATLTANGKTYKLMNRWTIPPHLEEVYCSGNVIIQDGSEIIELFEEVSCRGCGREYKNATKPKHAERPIILCSNNSDVNRHFGFVLPVCLDCYYYMQWIRGQKIPKSIFKRIQEGFIPYKIKDLV